MKLIDLIKKDESAYIAAKKKIIAAEEFSTLLQADELLKKLEKEEIAYREAVGKECEVLKEQAELAGFEEGLKKWNAKIQLLEQEIHQVREEMKETIVPLALIAVKKILGKELETKRETVVDIVRTVLKTVSGHRRISIFVNKADFDLIDADRPHMKQLFEHLESLTVAPRADVPQGGCVIETEAGIIRADLDSQLKNLETTFYAFFQNQSRKKK